jgi:putative DNA primase/helicase
MRWRSCVLPPSSLDVVAKLKRKAAPVLNFIDDECETGPDCSGLRDPVFEAYKRWCEDNNHRAMSKSAFVSAMEDANPDIKCRRPSGEGGERLFVFFGVKLRGAPAKVRALHVVA